MVRKLKAKKTEKYKSEIENEISLLEGLSRTEPRRNTQKIWDRIKDKKEKSPVFREIISAYTTKNEEDDDFYEYVDGLEAKSSELMREGNYEAAEKLLGEQLANESFHHYAFEMLAYADYSLRGKNEKNLWLMEHAVEIAEEFYMEDTLDIEVLDEMKENFIRIRAGKELLKWWE